VSAINIGQILLGPLFNEPMRVETVASNGSESWVLGLVGLQSEKFRKVTLTAADLKSLTIQNTTKTYDGDGHMLRRRAPFYLRRTKEAMVYFPERQPDGSWQARKIFTKRIPHTVDFQIDGAEFELYRDVTRFVKMQSAKAAAQAKAVEDSGTEAKLSRLKDLLHREGFFDHSDKRLLIFTEFKDTLDYLIELLKNWGFRVGFIHGGMKPGSREEPNSRIYTEQQFKDGAIQVLVATEAAGEGINLQCCHILFNYDIPWNPKKNLGYDITSLDLNSGELRLVEVKGIGAATGTVLLTPNERRVAEDRPACRTRHGAGRRDCYWLYVVTGCKTQPTLQEPIKNPARFPWHEVKKVDHYYLSVDALTQPMQVREPSEPYKRPGIDS